MSSAQSEFRTVAANVAPNATQKTNDALLEAAGPVVGEHVLVMGCDTPDRGGTCLSRRSGDRAVGT